MFRLLLPPNLAAAAARDAIVVRLELDRAAIPPADLLPVLAVLQRICGSEVPPGFIQLTRVQLGELAAAAGEQPVFVENGRPGPWGHSALFADLTAKAGVAERETPNQTGAASPRQPAKSPRPDRPPGLTRMTVDGSEHFLAITLPSPEHPGHAAALALLKTHGFGLEPSNRKWWLRDRHKTLNFLAAHGGRLREEFDADFTPGFTQRTAHLRPTEVAAEIAATGEGFAVTLALRAGSADEAQLRTALATSRSYVEAGGQIFLLAPARLAQLTAAQSALAGEPGAGLSPRRTQRIAAARVAEVEEILETLSPGFQAPAEWRSRSSALRNLSALAPAPVPAALDGALRPYQRLGVAWLWHLWQHRLGGILADEMGLGKTIQAIALLSAVGRGNPSDRSESLPNDLPKDLAGVGRVVPNAPSGRYHHMERRVGDNPPYLSLVVAPASLLENWRREVARFAPELRVFVHHAGQRLSTSAEFTASDLIITSYGTLARDQALFSQVEFTTVIADEAQHIKNRRSQNAGALRALRAGARFLLTGTPLENSLDDLRSLFEFLLPGFFTRLPAGVRGDERAWFDGRLRAQTAPYILRRTKRAVAPELPEKIEQTIWCELTPKQAALYRETQEKSERELTDLAAAGVGENQLRFAALTQLLRLRQICCDPRLLPNSEPGTQHQEPSTRNQEPSTRNQEPSTRNQERSTKHQEPITPPPFADSAKLDAFRELLAEAVDDGHRVLVFSQFTSLLALLRAELDAQGVGYCYLDGAMSAPARQSEVDRFQADPGVPVFLLSLKAGGTGLNLTGADTVVHFDPWWNPAVEAQATDRAHRIGQTRTVTSYKLIAVGTVEEKVLALQAGKRALLADVFEASDAAAAKLSLADLLSLAK